MILSYRGTLYNLSQWSMMEDGDNGQVRVLFPRGEVVFDFSTSFFPGAAPKDCLAEAFTMGEPTQVVTAEELLERYYVLAGIQRAEERAEAAK